MFRANYLFEPPDCSCHLFRGRRREQSPTCQPADSEHSESNHQYWFPGCCWHHSLPQVLHPRWRKFHQSITSAQGPVSQGARSQYPHRGHRGCSRIPEASQAPQDGPACFEWNLVLEHQILALRGFLGSGQKCVCFDSTPHFRSCDDGCSEHSDRHTMTTTMSDYNWSLCGLLWPP